MALQYFVPLLSVGAAALLIFAADAGAAAKPKKPVPMPRPRPAAIATLKPPIPAARPLLAKGHAVASALPMLPAEMMRAAEPPLPRQALALHSIAVPTAAPASRLAPADIAAVKRAIDLVQKGNTGEASEIARTVGDTAAAKLIEWSILRGPGGASFERYAAFVRANPTWPSVGLIRKRAEGALWDDRRDVAVVRAFFAETPPQSGKGRLALARALLSLGDREGAAHHVREAWRQDGFTAEGEQEAIAQFGDLIRRTDHKARMDRFLYSDERAIALRAAARLGGADAAIAKARIAVNAKAANAGALLDAVPSEARRDPGYLFSRIQYLRRKDKIAEAAQVMLSVPQDAAAQHDLDEWWIERRLVARELLDIRDHQNAYRIARETVPPFKENYRIDHEFTAGWIALRFLGQPAKALEHFARIQSHTMHPTSLARGEYWMGRALEAMGRTSQARAHYEAAARYSTAYYGQLARSRLGLRDVVVRSVPELSGEQRAAFRNVDIVRAFEILYAIDERELVLVMAADLTEASADLGTMVMLGHIARENKDARAMLYVGRAGIARGLPVEAFAFPEIGIPKFTSIGTEVDRGLVYAIARQESAFNQRAISTAKAMGLMQVTPAAGRYIAKRNGVTFDLKRLQSDPVYNTQMGAAELGDLVNDYRGSYLLAFVGYNAGRGRVRDWVARYGDPRNPQVDAIDWAERIPFSETRNYVQRVMENMQVFRARFGNGNRLTIEADLRGNGTGGMPESSGTHSPHVAQDDSDEGNFSRNPVP